MKTRIHPIELRISNAYLLVGQGRILIDTGSPGEEDAIIRALHALDTELSDLSLILHTHGHSDHCGSTAALVRKHRIPTAIHSMDSHMTEAGRNDPLKATRWIARFIRPFVDKPFPPFRCDLFTDALHDLSAYGVNATLHHTPGHTPGSLSLVTDGREAIIGDILMGGYMGGTFLPHLPDYHYFADDLGQIDAAIRKVLTFDADRFYVGHGGPLSRDRVEKRFLTDILRS